MALPMLYAGVSASGRHARAAALEAMGLGSRLHHMPNELSGGQQQRVAIARAIVMRPSLILADEPTGALDSRSSLEMMEIFQRFNADLGITVVIVTHETMIAEHTRHILRILDGQLSADEVVRHPRIAADALHRGAPTLLPIRRRAGWNRDAGPLKSCDRLPPTVTHPGICYRRTWHR